MARSGFPAMAQIFNKFVVYMAAVALAFMLGGATRSVYTQTISAPEREQLLNGLTILYGNSPGTPNVLLKLRIRSGAAFDLAGKAGMMSLLADAMFPENTTREYVTEQLGGRLDVATTYDSIDVTIDGKSDELERMIEILRNGIVNVNLSPESVASLRAERIKQLTERSSNAATADAAVSARLFGSYPYGSPELGTVATVTKIERADLMLARDRFLNAENATLVVIGGVEKARVMRDVRQLLGPWQQGSGLVPATFRQPGAVDDRVLLIDQATDKVKIRLAVRGLAVSDADTTAASVLASIARDRWKAKTPELSQVFVSHEPHLLPGLFIFGAETTPAAAGKAITAAKEVMQELAKSEPSGSEVSQVTSQNLWISHRPNQFEVLADAWLQQETYKMTPVNKDADALRVRPADIQRTAGRLFGNSAPLAIVVLGNAAQLQTQLGYKVELRSTAAEPKPAVNSPSSPRKP
jgi:zinc protease